MSGIGTTLREGEVQILDFIFNTMLRGDDPRMAMKHKDFTSLVRKVKGMKERLKKQAEERG